MKKILLTLGVFTLILVGCGKQEPTSTTTVSKKEIVEKNEQVSKSIKSVTADAVTKVQLTNLKEPNAQAVNVETTVNVKAVADTEISHAITKVKSDIPRAQSTEMEMYTNKENIFLKVDNTWQKLPNDQKQSATALLESKLTKYFYDQAYTTIETKDNEYVLTFKKNELTPQEMEDIFAESIDETMKGLLSTLKLSDFMIVHTIDKNNYETKKIEVNMKAEAAGVLSFNLSMSMDNIVYNTVNDLKIPQEVIDATK